VIDATPVLAPERASLLALLEGMSPADWERPAECPAWSVKGIALHILGDDFSLLSRQRDASTNSLMLYARDHPDMDIPSMLNAFNEQWVTAAEFLSVPQLIELLAVVGERSEAFYKQVDLDAIAGEPVGFFASATPSPYWHLIAREYAERVIHQSQIRRAIGAPELDGDLVTWMARVVVHALAAWTVGYRASDGATIAIDFGANGSWTWRRESEEWSVIEGVDTPAARVTVAPERVVALLTRGVSPSEASELLTISGDRDLALGAMAIAAPLLSP
jgi:uncharacterized protein (TIGR03083 family)